MQDHTETTHSIDIVLHVIGTYRLHTYNLHGPTGARYIDDVRLAPGSILRVLYWGGKSDLGRKFCQLGRHSNART